MSKMKATLNNKMIETVMKIEDVLKNSGLDYDLLRLPPDEQTQNDPHWTVVIEFNDCRED